MLELCAILHYTPKERKVCKHRPNIWIQTYGVIARKYQVDNAEEEDGHTKECNFSEGMNTCECRTQYVSFFERCKKPLRGHSCQSLGVSRPGYRYTKTKVISSLQLVC